MGFEVLIADHENIRVLTLNRPEKRNALNDDLIAALKAALGEADADENLRAIVIRGAGKDFCSGSRSVVAAKDLDRVV